ncbi:MAG TPA: acyl-ACP thioesterase domain-containing protein [Flavobacterium sp.]|jgi:acyl-ACP thioesterase|nr:acyl-ACP thioesterase domain-containing protein [Flavobacterium sp.]
MPVASDFTSIFSKEWEINITQCAPNGQLRHTELCNLLQLTAAAHAEKGGISFSDMQQSDQAWVLSRMRIEFDSMPMVGQTISIKTWIVSLVNSRSVRALEVYLNGIKIIGCETFWAVFNTVKRRPEPLALPDEHFVKYPEHFPTSERVAKIKIPEDIPRTTSRQVKFSDLDIVNHVNNVKYLEWCLDAVDTQVLLTRPLSAIDMNFTKELVLDDQIEIHEYLTPHHSIYSIIKEAQMCFALRLEWK